MKKSFLFLAALLIMGSSAFAIGGVDLSIGPKVGYQTSKLSYDKADIKAGFANNLTLGVFGRVEIGNLYVQPEILWFKTSSLFDMSIDTTSASFLGIDYPDGGNLRMTRNAMNIQVPVMIGYKLEILSKLALRVQVGPTANFIIPQKTMLNKTIGNDEGFELPEDKDFDTKSIAWGLQGGVGVDFLKFTLDINYGFGISKLYGKEIINNTQWGDMIDVDNIATATQNQFMVTVGYKFL